MLGATVGFEHLSLSVSLVAAFTNGLIYVLSLYIWNSKYKRSDPIVIKKKILVCKIGIDCIDSVCLFTLSAEEFRLSFS